MASSCSHLAHESGQAYGGGRKESSQQPRWPGQITHTLGSITTPLLRRAQPQAVLYSPTTGSWWVDRCHTWGLTGRPRSQGLLTVSTSQSSDLGTLPDFTKKRKQLQLGHTVGSFPWSLPLALCNLTCLTFLCGLRATGPVQDYRAIME